MKLRSLFILLINLNKIYSLGKTRFIVVVHFDRFFQLRESLAAKGRKWSYDYSSVK